MNRCAACRLHAKLHAAGVPVGSAPPTQALRIEMRELWHAHVQRTYHFIVLAVARLPDMAAMGAVARHLHANQDDIGALVARHFGTAAGTALAALLHAHIDIAAKVVSASVAKNDAAANAAIAEWRRNGSALAAFFHGANARVPLAALEALMTEHLNTTAAELDACLRGQWAEAETAYDRVVAHAMVMADALTDLIITAS